MTLSMFFDELASDSPAPGGGTVAALGAAAAAGLFPWSPRLTLGKEKFRDHWKEMETIAEKSDVLRSRFLRLMKEDADAFNELLAAMKLPKETKNRKKQERMPCRTRFYTLRSPPETLRLCADIALLAFATAERGNPNALTDAGAAAAFAFPPHKPQPTMYASTQRPSGTNFRLSASKKKRNNTSRQFESLRSKRPISSKRSFPEKRGFS
jgi:glutamate formiminotransferase/formiminotetrahydrofolate cyclodeaminase